MDDMCSLTADLEEQAEDWEGLKLIDDLIDDLPPTLQPESEQSVHRAEASLSGKRPRRRHVKQNGTRDARFEEDLARIGRAKKDGTRDARFKGDKNRIRVNIMLDEEVVRFLQEMKATKQTAVKESGYSGFLEKQVRESEEFRSWFQQKHPPKYQRSGNLTSADGFISLNRASRQVFVGTWGEIHLTPTEFELLFQLMSHPGEVLTHYDLLQRIWGESGDKANYLRIYVRRLRRKIEPLPTQPRYFLTQPGVGFVFRP